MYELKYLQKYLNKAIAGCDEVGRGPLAGPVVGASAYLEIYNVNKAKSYLKKLKLIGVTDSKKLTQNKRETIIHSLGFKVKELKKNKEYVIEENDDFKLSIFIKEVSHLTIDKLNILNASLLAMSDSFKSLQNKESLVLIDGNKYFKDNIDKTIQEPVVKGDSKSVLIGLASIFAKEYRDYLMSTYSKMYPGYGLESHAGYPTKKHREAIEKLGPTPIHRKTFKGVKEFSL